MYRLLYRALLQKRPVIYVCTLHADIFHTMYSKKTNAYNVFKKDSQKTSAYNVNTLHADIYDIRLQCGYTYMKEICVDCGYIYRVAKTHRIP